MIMKNNPHTSKPYPALYRFSKSILDPAFSEPIPLMAECISTLLAQYEQGAEDSELDLQLHHPSKNQRLLIASLYEGTIMIARMYQVDTYWLENMLITIQTRSDGWIPEEVRCTPSLWEDFSDSEAFKSGQSSILTILAEFVAEQLQGEGWLEQGEFIPEAEKIGRHIVTEDGVQRDLDDPDAAIWE